MRKSRKSLIWLSIFILMFSLFAPLLANAEGENSGASPSTFSDIQDHWAYNEITELAARGIVTGFENGTFQPSGNVTREQFLKMLVELQKLPHTLSDVPFKDVEQSRWSAPYIAAGLRSGILLATEFPDGFKPSQPITRYEMAIWVVRALHIPPVTDERLLGKLKDQADIRQNRELIEAALETGIIQGYPDGTFKGGNSSTRAEATVMLVRAAHYSPDQTATDNNSDNIVQYQPNVIKGTSTNYSQDSEGVWVINDPNLKLATGDVFYLSPNEEYPGGVAKKAESVNQQNGALFVKTSEPKLSEVFSKVQISADVPITPKQIVPADPSITVSQQEVAIQSTGSQSCFVIGIQQPVQIPAQYLTLLNGNFNLNSVSAYANVSFCDFHAIANMDIVSDFNPIDGDGIELYIRHSEFRLIGDIITKAGATIEPKAGGMTKPFRIPLGRFDAPIAGTPLVLQGLINLVIEPDLTSRLEITFEDRLPIDKGFEYSSAGGIRPISSNPYNPPPEFDVKSDNNVSLAVGPSLELRASLATIAYAGLEIFPGLKAGMEKHVPTACDRLYLDAFLKLYATIGIDAPEVIVWLPFVGDTDIASWLKWNNKYLLLDSNTNITNGTIHCPPTAPSKPQGLSGETQKTISWNTVFGATGYNLKRSSTSGGPYTTVRSNVNGTSYTDTTATNTSTYFYVVSAVNQYGESPNSPEVQVKPYVPMPTGLKATVGDKQVTLSWNAVPGAKGYNVKRSLPDGVTLTQPNGSTIHIPAIFNMIIASNVTSTTFTDQPLENGTTYIYTVSALNQSGTESANSQAVSAIPKKALPICVACGNVQPVSPSPRPLPIVTPPPGIN